MAYDASLGAEEKMGSLFQPDTLVPTQYFETFRGKAQLVYCPIISLTYIYDESYIIRHENSLSHRVVRGRTYGVEHLESRKKFAVALD